jgi:hypothetical protein
MGLNEGLHGKHYFALYALKIFYEIPRQKVAAHF